MAAASTLSATVDNQMLTGTADKDRIIIGYTDEPYNNVTVDAGAGNDTVQIQAAKNTSVNGGAGNDSIIVGPNSSASTVNTGAGNDTVVVWASDTTNLVLGSGSNVILIADDANLAVNAGADAEVSYVFANGAAIGKITISGSGGATLKGTGNSDLFAPGAGSNTIVGYGGEDTIQFSSSSSSVNGNDVILVGSGGTLTVADGACHKLNVNGSTVSLGSYKTYTPQQVIQKFMSALDNSTKTGTDALDEAILALNVDAFGSIQDVIDAAVADCASIKNADVFLRDKCGIILDNKDTGAITGWDAMGSTVKDAESVVPESGSFDSFSQDSFTVNGLTVKLEKTFGDLTDNQKKIYQGLHTWWTSEALKLISDSYGSNFSFSGGTDINSDAKTITVKFVSKGSFLAQVVSTTVSGGTATKLELHINEKYYNPLDTSDVNGYSTVSGSGYLDRTLAHEFTHAIMAATIKDFGSLPAYITEGMAELTHGIDDERATLISSLGGSSSKLKSALGKSTKTGNVSNYAGGYILLRYMALQAANSDTATGVRIKGKSAVITAGSDNTITTVDGTDDKFAAVVTLDASSSSRAVNVVGNKNDNIIIGSSAGGTLNGGTGKDKLYGSDGNDVFVHSIGSGSDVVGNVKDATSLYSTGDKILIVGDSTITDAGAVMFKDAKSALTVSFKGTSETVTINKADSLTPVTIELATAVGGSALKTITHGNVPTGVSLDSKFNATVTSAATSTVDVSDINSQIKNVNATEAGAVMIVGSDYAATNVTLGGNNTSVTGGYDYAKNKGFNDSFIGGDGKDVFVYSLGGGADKITGFNGADDAIVLLGFDDVTTIEKSGDVSYKDSGKALTLTLNGTVNGSAAKGSLTIDTTKSSGKVKVYKNTVSDANLILNYGVDFPAGAGYGKSTSIVTLGGGTSAASVSIDLVNDGYPDGVKEVDASNYSGKVSIVGNGNSDALTSGKAGGTLDGGYAIDSKSGNPKATGDKLYGNEGADTFIYRALESIGGGTDVIGGNKNFAAGNYDTGDRIIIVADTAPSASDIIFTDAKDVTTITIEGNKKSKLTVNKASSETTIAVCLASSTDNLSNVTTAVTHGSIPAGVGFAMKGTAPDYTMLTIGAASANSTVNASLIHSQIKTIDATKASYMIGVAGNAAANNISIGGNGGTLNGGGGNDKLFGGAGNDVFYYALGDGNDEINNYDGSKDTIILSGYTDTIDIGNSKVFKDSNGTITLDLQNGSTKGRLTLKNATGKIFVKDTAGNTLLNYRENVPDPDHISFVKNSMIIDSDANLANAATLKASDYGINVKAIDASAYSKNALCLVAGDLNNTSYMLTAGGGGSTIKGGTGADKLFGGGGKDVFVYSVGGGADVITSLNGGDGDELLILGYNGTTIDVTDQKVFKDSGKDITLTLNNQKLTIKNPEGQLKIVGGTQAANGTINRGEELLTYGTNLPTGVEYQSGKTILSVTSDATVGSLALDISDAEKYYSKLKTVNATLYGGALNVTGNSAANDLYAGRGGSTLNGGAGNDNLFGNSNGADTFVFDMSVENKGAKDVVKNYDGAGGDVIRLNNVDADTVNLKYNGKTLVITAAASSDAKKTGTLTVYGTTTDFKNYANIDTSTTVKLLVNGQAFGGSSQFASDAEDYWFTQPTDGDTSDELSSITESAPLAESTSMIDDPSELLRADRLKVAAALERSAHKWQSK